MKDSARCLRIFEPAFLKYLGGLKLRLDVDAIPEGTVIWLRIAIFLC